MKASLEACLSRKDKPTTFLFTGNSGTGKTTLGRIIGNMLEIDPLNVKVYNAASTRGIDTIREAIDQAKNHPMIGNKLQMFIFEECHGLTGTALEALLDFMEHPPELTYIVLTTTEQGFLKVTSKRRCHQYELKPLLEGIMKKLLSKIALNQKIDLDEKVLDKIVDVADGSPGQALKLLDMVNGISVEHALEIIVNISGDTKSGFELAQTLMNLKLSSEEKWDKCRKILQVITGEPESNRRIIQQYFTTTLLKRPHDDKTGTIMAIAVNFSGNYYDSGKLGLMISCYMSC